MFHITLAYYLLTSPLQLVEQSIVIILGESMHLPQVSAFDKASPATAFLGLLFAFLGVADLTAVSMTDHVAIEYWNSQAPIRLLFLFPLTAYIYLVSPTSDLAFNIKNGFIFTWAFLELGIWFMVFLGLREETQRIRVKK